MAVFPVDPTSGGTWIGVNDAGLVVALLNRHGVPPCDGFDLKTRSRGLIVPTVLGCGVAAEAIDAACQLDLPSFAPFLLLATDGAALVMLSVGGGRTARTRVDLTHPLMFTSSSLGDEAVDGPRRKLFERLVLNGQNSWLDGQRRFHRHRWRDRLDLSVEMERSDARTVSRSIVDVMPGRTVFQYEPLICTRGSS